MDFVLFNSVEDKDFANMVLNALNVANQRFFSLYGKQVDEKLNVKIYPTREEYKDFTGYGDEYRDYMVGKAKIDDNLIAIITPRVLKDRTEEDMLKVVVHEFGHFIMGKVTIQTPKMWLGEGFACWFAEQFPKNKLDKVISLKDLSSKNFVSLGGYSYAPVYVDYLIKKYGFQKIIDLFGESFPEKFLPKDFEKEALEYFNNKT